MINKTIKNYLIGYVVSALSGSSFNSYKKFGPNEIVPDVEGMTSPFILLDIDETGNEQFTLGSRSTRKTGFITITFVVKKGQGINLVSEFKGFVDGIGLATSNGVVYKEPVEMLSPAKFKDWEPTCIALPFQFDNYV